MAIRHGLAGQYGKSEAQQRIHRMMDKLFVIGMSVTAITAFVGGYFFGKGGYWPLAGVPIFVVIYVAGTRYVNRMDPFLDKLAKERIKYLRGGQLEALVAWLLEDLDDNWHIYNGVKLESSSDIDHVLLGPGGLFCISTKSQRGHFKGTPDGVLHNGRDCSFAKQTFSQAMQLKDRLCAMMGGDVPWIQPVLAVPLGFVEGDACGGKVWVVHQEDIKDRLAPEATVKRLSKEQVARVAKVLEMIQTSAAAVYQRPH